MGALVGGAIAAIDNRAVGHQGQALRRANLRADGGKDARRVRCYMHAKGDTLDELVADAVAKKRHGFTAIRFSPFAPDYHRRNPSRNG